MVRKGKSTNFLHPHAADYQWKYGYQSMHPMGHQLSGDHRIRITFSFLKVR